MPATVAHRLLLVSTRLRERALAAGTFDGELAEDVEELARLAAIVSDVCHDLRRLHAGLFRDVVDTEVL